MKFPTLLLSCLILVSPGFLLQSLEAQNLDHRKSDLTICVKDAFGAPVPNATLSIEMTRHAFKFGSQIRDRLITISQTEFDALTENEKQGLVPDLTDLGIPRYTPVWTDVLNYRQTVFDNFNHAVPTIGMQWITYQLNGPAVQDAAHTLAQSNGLSTTGASVVWQRDQWPTPYEFRPEASPDPLSFHTTLLADRLGTNGVMARFSTAGAGPNIMEWKVCNEPLHESYFADTFVNAGIYATELEAIKDYFDRARAQRPAAILSINEFNILNFNNDSAAQEYRDLINDLLAAGASIDRIGVQAHIALNNVSKSDMKRRLDILAQTGLEIEITEFDTRDDSGQLTPAEQERVFRDVLEVAFEHPSVSGFIMWGFWDPGHWRGNGPLFDQNWNVKPEAAPWFDLVMGDWKPNLQNQPVDPQGIWSAVGGLFDGDYEIEVSAPGVESETTHLELLDDESLVLTVPAVVVPDSMNVIRGVLVSGGVAELGSSDNADLSVSRLKTDIQSRTLFNLAATSAIESPTVFEVTLESSVFARSAVDQRIELYDFPSDQWEVVDERRAARFSDMTVKVSPDGDLSRFVESGTGLIRARIRFRSSNQRQQFTCNTDHFSWAIR